MVSFDDLTDEQQTAATALDRSVSLTAGAGTGKTTTLTERYVTMIEQSITATAAGDDGRPSAVDPSTFLTPRNILTTTFTERAADELTASVRTAITERMATEPPERYPYWRAVADELEEGYIHTLHGFCARLLRENILDIDGLDPGFDTLDEEETAALIDWTVERVLADDAETAPDVRRTIETLARRFDRRGLHAVLTDLLGERPESIEWARRVMDMDREEYVADVRDRLHPVDQTTAADKLADDALVDATDRLRAFVTDPPDAVDPGGTAWTRAVDTVDALDETVPDEDTHDGVPNHGKRSTLVAVADVLTKNPGDRYASYTGAKTNWSDDEIRAAFDEAIETIVEVIEPEQFVVDVDVEADAAAFPFVQALGGLTLAANAAYTEAKRDRNAADFTDLVSHAVAFLGAEGNEPTRTTLRDQFEYVMVDEFQDTDPRQWELVKILTTADPDVFDGDNVFVVGDVKQSIYRFRNADVTQFDAITAEIERAGGSEAPQGDEADSVEGDERAGADEDGESDQLTTNFRTLPSVLETVNDLFDEVFEPDGEAYEATPQRLGANRDDPAGVGSVEYLAVPTDPELRRERFDEYEAFADARPDDDSELEAMALAARLTRLLTEPAQVYPTDDADDTSEPRDVQPSDVAVLLRSRTDLPAYERAFDSAGVPYTVASGLGFYETTEVTALTNLLRALADPTNDRALYAILRSPLFGFTDDTLARVHHSADSLWDGITTTEIDRLRQAATDLRRWRRLAGVAPADDEHDEDTSSSERTENETSWPGLVTQIVEETGFVAAVSADERPEQARANVAKFREELRGYAEDGVESLTTLVERLDRRIERSVRESEADTTGDGVQVLTVHDAKGMEFPVVVVPGLGRGFNNQAALGDGRVEFERVGGEQTVGLKAPDDDPFEFTDTVARERLREQRRDEEHAEEKRVLYVACTRARDHLLLSGRHDIDDESDTATLTGLESADPTEAKSWRDWVQPVLFDDDLLTTLDTAQSVERTTEHGSYVVSLPEPRVEVPSKNDETGPRLEMSPDFPEPTRTPSVSATEYADRVTEPETGEHDTTVGDPIGMDSVADTETRDRQRPVDVSPSAFGKAVHKLCELRPPREKWASVARQEFAAEGAPSPDAETLDRIRDHAEYGTKFVDELTADADTVAQYDELFVRATVGSADVYGFIDHLLVTSTGYHVVDYKTGPVENGVEAAADEYLPQLRAYAAALSEHDPDSDVTLSLVFTDARASWQTTFTSDELDGVRASVAERLRRDSTDE